MKRLIIPVILCCLAAISCAKEGTRLYTGSYSFKTSGTITVTDEYGDNPMRLSLPTESGIMDIVEVDREAGTMIVTMNVLNGDLMVFDAYEKSDSIFFTPSARHTTLSYATLETGEVTSLEDLENISVEKNTVEGDFAVSAGGKRYDDIIILDFNYQGGITFNDGSELIISESDVKCRAKLNED